VLDDVAQTDRFLADESRKAGAIASAGSILRAFGHERGLEGLLAVEAP
jgi:hypothetical protein